MSCVNPRSDLVSSVNETGLSLVLNMAPALVLSVLCHLTEPNLMPSRSEWKWSVDVCTSEWNTYTFAQLWGFRLSSQHWSYQRTELHNLHCIWLVLTVCLRGPVVTKHSIWMMYIITYMTMLLLPGLTSSWHMAMIVWCGNKGCMHLRAYRPTCVNSAFLSVLPVSINKIR